MKMGMSTFSLCKRKDQNVLMLLSVWLSLLAVTGSQDNTDGYTNDINNISKTFRKCNLFH